MDAALIQEELLTLSHALGSPAHNWAILGEGNTSARLSDDTFAVKASGSQLSTLTAEQVACVRFAPILDALTGGRDFGDETRDLLLGACVGTQGRMPSVETLMHAYLLTLPGVAFVGHTHVQSINALLCSVRGWQAVLSGGRLFPDEIVVCGIAPCCVPYVDPGLPLARTLRAQVEAYIAAHGVPPKTIYLQNHGFIALGRTHREVESIHQMADKAAHVLAGALALGEPTYLTPQNVARIYTWPAEHFRQKALGLSQDS